MLIAALELFEPLETPVRVHRCGRDLKTLLHSMRELRDTQVEERRVKRENLNSHADQFLSELAKQKKLQKQIAAEALLEFNAKRLKREIRSLITYLDSAAEMEPGFERDLRALCNQHIRERFARVTDAIQALPEQSPPPLAIHQVRIRLKQFHYAWDLVSPHLKDSRETEKTLKDFQSLLGAIQDLHVLLSSLMKFAHHDLTPFARKLSRRQKILIGKFQKSYPTFQSAFKTPLSAGVQVRIQ